ncbi:MAG: hypothetical protein AMJ60_07880 [Desulfobacterales bacterium SG8_35]|nr:MAG: hypothetical protein AMJ60_07880 [Desulfobacterales bacterium SG8_35]
MPRQINTFFRELRNSYEHETPRTKEFIHAFLTELKSAYNPRLFPANFSKQTTQDNLAFSRRRMAAIVRTSTDPCTDWLLYSQMFLLWQDNLNNSSIICNGWFFVDDDGLFEVTLF